jgi:hypothetical protein
VVQGNKDILQAFVIFVFSPLREQGIPATRDILYVRTSIRDDGHKYGSIVLIYLSYDWFKGWNIDLMSLLFVEKGWVGHGWLFVMVDFSQVKRCDLPTPIQYSNY